MHVIAETRDDKRTFPCGEGETFLSSGLSAGVGLPYECATGSCGSCHARVVSGEVDFGWADAPGYRRLKREKGDILMCQASPLSDCHIKLKGQIAPAASAAPANLYRTATMSDWQRLNDDVVQFALTFAEPMTFEAGQFVTVEAPGLPGRRAYSMVNFEPAATTLTFVVKTKPGGGFSQWLASPDRVGETLRIVGPLGRATFRPHERRHPVFISGGSGIAGMLAMLERARREDYFAQHAGDFFFGVKGLKDLFYASELNEYATAAAGALRIVVALSDEAPRDARHPEFPAIEFAQGFVHDVAAAKMADRWDNRVGFVAGPEPMVNGALRVLIAQGKLPLEFVRFDKFS